MSGGGEENLNGNLTAMIDEAPVMVLRSGAMRRSSLAVVRGAR